MDATIRTDRVRTDRARSTTLRINYLLCRRALPPSYMKQKEAERHILRKDDFLRPIVGFVGVTIITTICSSLRETQHVHFLGGGI
jgi:hypothetical protein